MSAKLLNPKTGKEVIDPKTDFAFKKLFASDFDKSKRRLLSLINAFVSKDHKIVGIKEINVVNPYSMGKYVEGKEAILDIRAFNEKGIWYNIAIQNAADISCFNMALFYWSKVYTNNFNEGDEYSNLNRTIGIQFLDFNYIEPQKYIQSTKYHHTIAMRDSECAEMKFYGMDLCEIHLIELKKLDKSKMPEDSAEEWARFFDDPISCINNKELIKTPQIQETLDDLDKLNLLDKEREAYEESLNRSSSDKATLLYHAEQKGKEEGKREEKFALAKALKEDGMAIEKIMKLTGLTGEEIKALHYK